MKSKANNENRADNKQKTQFSASCRSEGRTSEMRVSSQSARKVIEVERKGMVMSMIVNGTLQNHSGRVS